MSAQLPSAWLSVAAVGREVFGVGGDKGVGPAVAHFKSLSNFYGVGSAAGRDGLIWHWDGTHFIDEVLPADRPRSATGELPALFNAWGTGDDVWAVASVGTILHRKGSSAFETIASGVTATLFTVHGQGSDVFVVGGSNQGTWLQRSANGAFVNIAPVGTLLFDPPVTPIADAADAPRVVCPAAEVAAFTTLVTKNTARQWDELILSAICRDLPRPTVHARNLSHLSAALWDVFSAYESIRHRCICQRTSHVCHA